jgi:hypothetical protein
MTTKDDAATGFLQRGRRGVSLVTGVWELSAQPAIYCLRWLVDWSFTYGRVRGAQQNKMPNWLGSNIHFQNCLAFPGFEKKKKRNWFWKFKRNWLLNLEYTKILRIYALKMIFKLENVQGMIDNFKESWKYWKITTRYFKSDQEVRKYSIKKYIL